MKNDSRAAWSQFWSSGGRGSGSGCLPQGLKSIDAVQRRIWAEAVRALPRRASVLDLASGDGAVLVKMQAVRPDLQLVGVDSASAVPKPPKGIRLRTGVAMEKLPFPDRSFDLVSSQFGVEYGDVPAIAAECVRVLKPGAAFAFLVHHAAGPVVAHNVPRAEALEWAVAGSGLLERARNFARSRTLGPMPVPPSFAQTVLEARQRFATQTVAAEFCEAVRLCLEYGCNDPPAATLAALAELQDKAGNELARIGALRGAARDAVGIGAMQASLSSAGLDVRSPEPVSEDAVAAPFGWLLRGTRPL